jgi:heme exporter protein C
MAIEMLWPFIFCFIGFSLLVSVIVCLRLRNEILLRNSLRPWVRKLAMQQQNN